MSREAIYNAALQRLLGLPGVVQGARRFAPPETLTIAATPTIFLLPDTEDVQAQALNLPAIRRIRALIAIYNKVDPDDFNSVPESAINNLIDALDQMIDTGDSAGFETLGGLVYAMKRSGEVKWLSGWQTGLAGALVPVDFLVP